MRKWLLTLALFAGLNGLCLAEPKVEVPETSWDFGHVPQNSTLTHDYWVKNVGTDTLKIIQVKPG